MFKRMLLILYGVSMFVGVGGGVINVQQAAAHVPVEIVAATTSVKQDSIGTRVVSHTKSSWPWYLTRGAGLAAAVLMVLLMLSGIGLLTGHTYKILEPLAAWTMHRAMGFAFGVSVLVHILALLFDKYAPFNLFELFLPFVSRYKPVSIGSIHLGSLYVALGILAFYAIVAVVVSSIVWIDKKPSTWKWLHYLSYLAMAAVFVHGITLGTDLRSGTLRVLWIFGGIVIATATIMRLWRAWTISQNK